MTSALATLQTKLTFIVVGHSQEDDAAADLIEDGVGQIAELSMESAWATAVMTETPPISSLPAKMLSTDMAASFLS